MACRALLPQDVRVDMGPLGTLRLEEQLDEKLQRVASEELREADVDIPDTIAALRTRLQEEKELVVPLDDEYMTTFLRPCHWYPDSAFQKMCNFYAFKARNPHVGRPLPMSRLDVVANSGTVCILPRRDQFGRRMLLLQTGRKWDPKKLTMDELLSAVLMFLEIAIVEPSTQVAGVVILWDLEGLSLSQDCVPLRVKAFHFINQSNLFDIAFNVLKPFLKEKLRSRVTVLPRQVFEDAAGPRGPQVAAEAVRRRARDALRRRRAHGPFPPLRDVLRW
ncbi:retinaldehyde-binding protein 1-like isoform X1 [Gryllus bimaculatus]|nr:retinaldehyde-binding protein 1-like isoform X1 [Gryllus bimaculatus]